MGKRKNETEEERKERKRLKKENKRKKKEQSQQREQEQVKAENDEQTALSSADAASKVIKHPPSPLFQQKNLNMTISLLPGSLGSVTESVEEVIRGYLLKYSDTLGGILLAFEHLKLLNDGKGRILEELPFIHYEVQCSALVFQPIVGEELEGKVVESFHSHVSVIVFEYFNASITAEQLRKAGFRFDDTREQWVKQDTTVLNEGRRMRFRITRVHESGGIISIDGTNPLVL